MKSWNWRAIAFVIAILGWVALLVVHALQNDLTVRGTVYSYLAGLLGIIALLVLLGLEDFVFWPVASRS